MVYMRRTGAYGIQNYKLMAALKEWANRKGLLKDSIIYGIACYKTHFGALQAKTD